MKTITFQYTKKDNKTSDRTLLVLSEPTSNIAGIDLSELSPEQAADFARLYEQMHDAFLIRAKALQASFDLTHSYRQFIPAQMSQVEEV